MTPHFSSLIPAYQLHFYLWFKTHYRRPLLLTENSQSLVHDVLSEVCARQHYHLLDTDISKDNLRVLVSLKPRQSVSQTVKFLKGNISRQFGLAFTDLLRAHSSRSLWARGYFATSSGKVNVTNARKYVDSQAVHHGYQGKWTHPLKFRNPQFKSPAFSFEHCLCQLDYHLVVATQNRLPLFDESIAPHLFNYILAIGRKHHFAVDRVGLMPDHMHLIVEAVPSQSVYECVNAILENTRHWMTKRYTGVLKEMNGWDVWQPSFYAATVGEYSTAQVREFLRMK
jgi:putative transposase